MLKKIRFEVPGVRPELLQPVGMEFTKDGKYLFAALGPGATAGDGSAGEQRGGGNQDWAFHLRYLLPA